MPIVDRVSHSPSLMGDKKTAAWITKGKLFKEGITMNPVNAFDLFDRLFETGHFTVGAYPAPSFPPVDTLVNKETKDLTFRLALAGYTKDEVKLTFEGDYLVLNLTKKEEEKDDKVSILRKGIRKESGTWRLAVPSTKYETSKVSASFNDGILTVNVPAKEEQKPKAIEILA